MSSDTPLSPSMSPRLARETQSQEHSEEGA